MRTNLDCAGRAKRFDWSASVSLALLIRAARSWQARCLRSSPKRRWRFVWSTAFTRNSVMDTDSALRRDSKRVFLPEALEFNINYFPGFQASQKTHSFIVIELGIFRFDHQ